MTTVIIVDDQNSIREFLKINLSTEADIEVVGMADNGQSAIVQVEEHQPDIVLMDIEMPGKIDGIEATKAIAARFPQTKVLLFTSRDDREQLNRALVMGARGYILKNTSIKDIGHIIRLTEKGFFQIGPILGNWDGSNINPSTSLTELQTKSIPSQVKATARPNSQYSYAHEVFGHPSQIDRVLSNSTSGVTQLQETIDSQNNTILDSTNQYSQVQREIKTKLRKNQTASGKRRTYSYNTIIRSKPLSQTRQHFLFIISFLLGVFTITILMMMVKLLGG